MKVLIILFALGLCVLANASPPPQKPDQHIVITQSQSSTSVLDLVDIDQADVRESIRKLFRAVGISYSIAPEIQGTVMVTLRNVHFIDALNNILKQVDGTYRVEGGVYQIIPRQVDYPVLPSSSPGFIITLESPGASFEATLKQLSRCGIRYDVEGANLFVLGANQQPLGRIEQVSRNRQNTVAQDNDYLYNLTGSWIEKVRKSDSKVVATCDLTLPDARSHAIVEPDPKNPQLLRRVDFFQVDVREALDKLFKVAGMPYSVDADVMGTIDLQLENVPFETALQAVVKKAKATYRAQPVYHVVLAESQPGSQLRITELSPGSGFSIEDLIKTGLRYRLDAGVYSLLDEKGQALGTLEPAIEDTPPASVTQDDNFLHIVIGSRTFDVRKSDLRVQR